MFKLINKRLVNFLMANKVLWLKKNKHKWNSIENVSKFLWNWLKEMQNQVKKKISR